MTSRLIRTAGAVGKAGWAGPSPTDVWLDAPEMLTAALQAPDPDAAWAAVVEEGLRYTPPVRHILLRCAVDDVEIAGVTVAKGEAVMASVMAVGRDGSRHTNPDSFDTTRSTNREHTAFGRGAHYCLGARLARLEAQIALRALFTRYPHLTLAAEPQRMASISEQGLLSLSVHLHGIKGAAVAAEGRQTAAAASSQVRASTSAGPEPWFGPGARYQPWRAPGKQRRAVTLKGVSGSAAIATTSGEAQTRRR
ncbi:cytochrome P450 [Streptomyces sp. ISL-10]|uniref:cytochrome P450 n=1 Tax=Streptomyces sp. ISL-10 TaxID=2819172 RepID=UPI001BECCC1B|nr:cytochrome P450 [Streptomyces sp. ISL-10]MBT2369366.1 cytochrome P450 [Streptomyces sp. ISL-10]